jgi:hypothetical protein
MPVERLTGYLLTVDGFKVPSDASPARVLVSKHLQSGGELASTRWLHFTFRSERALLNEQQLALGAFEYPVFFRQSSEGRVLLLAQNAKVVDRLLEEEAGARKAWKDPDTRPLPLVRTRIAVHDLVKSLVAEPRQYVLTRADANVPGRSTLKYMSFYGDDLGDAILFRQNLKELRCYACALRDVSQRQEVLRVTSSGVVSFRFSSPERAKKAEKALNFLYKNNFLRGLVHEPANGAR